jgi:hypothetical protein
MLDPNDNAEIKHKLNKVARMEKISECLLKSIEHVQQLMRDIEISDPSYGYAHCLKENIMLSQAYLITLFDLIDPDIKHIDLDIEKETKRLREKQSEQ